MLVKVQPNSGKILIAEPLMVDPNFKRSVILLTQCDEEGSIGFILNQKSKFTLGLVYTDLPFLSEADVFIGGPVNNDRVHFLHNVGELIEGSQHITGNLYWGGNLESVKTLSESGIVTKDNFRFYIGYSGWGSEQLIEEINEHTWIVSDYDQNFVMHESNTDEIWKQAILKLEPEYHHFLNFPTDPYLN
jgi:putative transcriptional regulator